MSIAQKFLLELTAILFIVDPVAAVPSFLAMTARDTVAARRTAARRGAWTVFITLVVFAAGGTYIFKLFGITLAAFKVAGGILIGLSAMDMVQARRSQQQETPEETAEGIEKADIGIVPLGIPMLAGAGSISTVMVSAFAAKTVWDVASLFLSIAITAYACYATLRAATAVEKRLGRSGMRVLTRVMGLFLLAISIQYILDGIRAALEKST
ncbi:MAG TPA: NAAT family transporter [Gemmatimonadales bacterium]|nr:NAAT family transporter [Gemmatimonadales bacterium]